MIHAMIFIHSNIKEKTNYRDLLYVRIHLNSACIRSIALGLTVFYVLHLNIDLGPRSRFIHEIQIYTS